MTVGQLLFSFSEVFRFCCFFAGLVQVVARSEGEIRRDKSLFNTRGEHRNGKKVRINYQYFRMNKIDYYV